VLLDLPESPLDGLSVGLIIFRLSNQGCQLSLALIFVLFFFILIKSVTLDYPLDLLFNFPILLFKKVSLCRQQVNIVEKTVVLLLCLYEGCDYFLF